MRILVTGARGFLGRYICELLVEKGHDVIGLTHSSNENNNPDHSLKYIQLDITKKNEFKKLEEQHFDSIIHNAAYVDFKDNYFNFKKLFKVNADGCLNVLDYAFENDVNHVVYSSSVSVYEKNKGFISENDVCSPNSFYGMSKLIGEFLCKKYHNKGINSCIFRYGGIYGYGAKHPVSIMNFIERILNGKEITLYNENSLRNYVYVKDAALANLFVVENKIHGDFNIVSDDVLKIFDMMKIISNIFKEYEPHVNYSNDNVENNVIYDIKKFKNINRDFPLYSFNESIKEIKKIIKC